MIMIRCDETPKIILSQSMLNNLLHIVNEPYTVAKVEDEVDKKYTFSHSMLNNLLHMVREPYTVTKVKVSLTEK